MALPVVTIDGPEACCDVDDAAMICAVLEFSYAGTDTSPKLLVKNGFYTANLGDCAQTIAARGVLERLGLTAADVPGIDRDTLPDYDGPPAALLMNGVFYDRNFPVSDRITPVFIGFCTKSAALVQGASRLVLAPWSRRMPRQGHGRPFGGRRHSGLCHGLCDPDPAATPRP
ncbi:MAG: hypothetical protein O9289_02295 [Rhodobacteraceae bacterium]|nr:hypothetical protein [Paracoccaceae bacterium]MCZ8082004.1 hypothetical protein [Paracoccaceae bacterium]